MSLNLKTSLGPTPQSKKADPRQVKNSAGGYTFTLDPLKQLERFVIIGVDSGTFYATPQKHTDANLDMVRAVVADRPKDAVDLIHRVSTKNLAVKVDPALAALAVVLSSPDHATRKLGYSVFADIVRTGSHLFQILGYLKQTGRGWSSGLKRVVQAWYTGKSGHNLAYQLLKYQQREGWSHRDVLRLAKPKPTTGFADTAFAWAVGKAKYVPSEDMALDALALDHMVPGAGEPNTEDDREVARLILAYERVKAATKASEVARIIGAERLPHECVPSQWRKDAEVWRALLKDMPFHALLRNLSTLARVGVNESGDVSAILEKLGRVKGSHVHPIQVLLTMKAYQSGRGDKGSSTWTPSSRVVAALDDAFYAAYGEVEPTGKRVSISLDVSGSMDQPAMGNMTHREIVGAIAAVLAATEKSATVRGFTAAGSGRQYGGQWGGGDPVLVDIDLRKRRLDDVCRMMKALPMGGTDCSLPMRHALAKKEAVDLFIVATDNETWAGPEHPHVSLQNYRRKMGIDAKLVVLATTATPFTIANPSDAGMLDIVGFSADVPQVIRSFAVG